MPLMSLTYNCERKIYCLLGNKNKRRKSTNAKNGIKSVSNCKI